MVEFCVDFRWILNSVIPYSSSSAFPLDVRPLFSPEVHEDMLNKNFNSQYFTSAKNKSQIIFFLRNWVWKSLGSFKDEILLL